MPKRKPPTPRTGHVYERTERPQGGYLHTCTQCDRKITNDSGLPPQQFQSVPGESKPQLIRCPHGEVITAEQQASAFDDAGAGPAPKPKRKRRRKATTHKTTKRGKR